MEQSNYTVQQLINDPSFVKWAAGQPGEETEKWDRWVKQSEENRKIALRAQKKITGVRFASPNLPDVRDEWAKVQYDIKNKRGGISRDDHGTHDTHPSSNGRWLNHLFKAAAVLLVGAFVGFTLYMYQEPKSPDEAITLETIQTGYGEKKTINLTDGSKVILAADSKISYKSNWLEQPVKRVSLSGEAYFSISPKAEKNRPKFIVETRDGSASVWGTRFTVDTYGSGTHVVLEEGEVRVEVANAKENGTSEITMKPGERATFSRAESNIELDQVNPSVYTSWTTNELFFDNTPFSVLVNRMERTYGVQVTVEDPKILDMKLSGSIDFRNLEGLIKATSDVMEVNIYKSGKTVIIKRNNNQQG